MKVTRLFDLIDKFCLEQPQKKDIFNTKINGTWKGYSVAQYKELTDLFSLGLLNMGINKGDVIATVSSMTVSEWNFIDMGAMQLGVVHVPLYHTLSDEEFIYILNHCEAKILFVSHADLYEKLKKLLPETGIKYIYTILEYPGLPGFTEIVEIGRKNLQNIDAAVIEKTKQSINENDLATIIYTSGTTGLSKGVMLSHKNIVCQLEPLKENMPLNKTHTGFSFLPVCHILERATNYLFQFFGMKIYYAESVEKIAENMRDVAPHGFCTVPRMLEKLYDKIIARGKMLSFIQKNIFFWAVKLGLEYDLTGKSAWYKLRHKIADKLIYSKWRAALGGNVKFIVCGGAAIQDRLVRSYWAAGIPVHEGYGLSETSPIIVASLENRMKFGYSGSMLMEHQQIKIADDGEILYKGDNLMLGYYKNEELTKEVIDSDGWFHTGDIGELHESRFLKITDRKKEMFKLSTGKYIAPQVVENIFKESLFIEQLIVIGEGKHFVSALIVPNFEYVHNWCFIKKVFFKSNVELVKNERVISRFQREIDIYNQRLGKTEQIKKFRLLNSEWTANSGELSPTLKLRRKFVMNKYSTYVDDIYNETK